MPDHRTTVTELITGLGTLGMPDMATALAARPPEMVSVSPEQWDLLAELHGGGLFRQEFEAAWQNGVAFLAARDGLRGRRPVLVEWRGGQRQPGDEPVPADLRIDHVFLVSCKYLSKIVSNSSPSAVFDRLLAGGHGGRAGDWFAEVVPDAYQALYCAVVDHLDAGSPTPPGGTDVAAPSLVGPPGSPAPSRGPDVAAVAPPGGPDAAPGMVAAPGGSDVAAVAPPGGADAASGGPDVAASGGPDAAPGGQAVAAPGAAARDRPAGLPGAGRTPSPVASGAARASSAAGLDATAVPPPDGGDRVARTAPAGPGAEPPPSQLGGWAGAPSATPGPRSPASTVDLFSGSAPADRPGPGGGRGPVDLPAAACDLTAPQRAVLKDRLGRGRWPTELRPIADAFSVAVAEATAARWQRALAGADPERVLWRLLRIGGAPYFVLGASDRGSLRLRIGTAWDWRQHFRLERFTVTAAVDRAQPVVEWSVEVANRRSAVRTTVAGHVEIRWSHGKFAQPPEAKVYLDTPHHEIPGYWPLA